jgi:hypothetical protein
MLELQGSLMGYICNERDHNIGVMMSPLFVYRRGHLWMQEQQLQKLLASKNINWDKGFSLLFKERLDARDLRPLTYPGRLVHASHVKDSEWFWRTSKLAREGRTELASQLMSRDMVSVEDLDPTSLPASVDTTGAVVQGARKFEQIGGDAADKLMTALFEGATIDSRSALIVVDLNVGVGNMFDVGGSFTYYSSGGSSSICFHRYLKHICVWRFQAVFTVINVSGVVIILLVLLSVHAHSYTRGENLQHEGG